MIKISRYAACDKPPLVGFLDVEIEPWHLEIRGITLMQKDGKRWFNLPSKPYQDKDTGETKYSGIVRFTNDDWYKNFMASLKTAFDEYCSAQQPTAEPIPDAPFSSNSGFADNVPF